MSSAAILWPNQRPTVPRVQHYLEVTVPDYTLDDFKSLSREAYHSTCMKLTPLPDYNKPTDPIQFCSRFYCFMYVFKI